MRMSLWSCYCVAITAFGLAALGCPARYGWFGGLSPRYSPHESSAALSDDVRAPARQSGASTSEIGAVRVVELAFNLLRADLPVESVRHTQKIWNHVDQLRVGPDTSARLARNGLRIGTAVPGAWPAISTILSACGARIYRDQLLSQRGLSVALELGRIDDSESIFSFSADNRLVGKTFAAGTKLMNLDYAVRPELDAYVDLGVSLEVLHEKDTMTWERRDGAIRQVPAVDRHVFEDVSALVAINQGEFLVIGPGGDAENEYLLGHRFFTSAQGGVLYETVFFITPVPYQSDGSFLSGG